MTTTNEAITAALIESLSDTDTGPLSDTPYVRAEVNDEGGLDLFMTEDEEAWAEAAIDIPQLANVLADALAAVPAPTEADFVTQAEAMSLIMQQHYLDPQSARLSPDNLSACVCGEWSEGAMEPGWDDHLADVLAYAGFRRTPVPASKTQDGEAREALASLIEFTGTDWEARMSDNLPTGPLANEQADAILAAGYQRPRTVSTVEELDALPDGSVVLNSRGHVCEIGTVQFRNESPARVYYTTGNAEDWPIERMGLPATVLYVPISPEGGETK